MKSNDFNDIQYETGKTPLKSLTIKAAFMNLLLTGFWGGYPASVKIGLKYSPPLRLGWMRFVVGGIVVLFWALISKKNIKIKKSEIIPLIFLGILFSIQLAFMNFGLVKTSSAMGVILTNTSPLWVALLSHFFVPNDKLTKIKLLGISIAYLGVLYLFLEDFSIGISLYGNLFMLISGFLLGFRQVFLSVYVKEISPAKLLLAQAILGTLFFVIASILFEKSPFILNFSLLISILYQGGIVAGFNFIVNISLLERFKPSQISIIHLFQPIFGILIGWIILKEIITPNVIIAAFLVMIGSVIVLQSDNSFFKTKPL